MVDLDLRPERRDKLAAWMRAELEALIPGSGTALRGSLATGTADPYSDIDLCWVVGDETFRATVSAIAELAARLPSVQAVRIDPGLARSDRRRLVFVRLAQAPLFWRVDLDVRARSVAAADSYDDANPAALDATGWSPPASAIENAIAAIKSGVRGRTDVTSGLLSRGYERIGLAPAPDTGLAELITKLAESCAELEPGLASLASEVREVAEALLLPPSLRENLGLPVERLSPASASARAGARDRRDGFRSRARGSGRSGTGGSGAYYPVGKVGGGWLWMI